MFALYCRERICRDGSVDSIDIMAAYSRVRVLESVGVVGRIFKVFRCQGRSVYVIDILESFRKSLEACRDGVLSVSNRRITAAHVVGEPVNFR